MAKKMLIDATHAEETRVVVVDGNRVEEFDFESHSKRQITGNIYLAKVTRVEPSLQAAFVEYGGNRHGFLAFSEIHPDYYQIPKEDREALLAEEAALARAEEENGKEKPKPPRTRGRRRAAATKEGAPAGEDAVLAGEAQEAGTEADAGGADDAGPAAASAGAVDEAEEPTLEDVPPPSAAGGGIDIEVPEEPEDAAAPPVAGEGEEAASAASAPEGGEPGATAAEEPEPADVRDEEGEFEALGGDDVEEERVRPRLRPTRRYKIQEVIKVRQILLVQVVKEERGNKGAALTTYLSLAGRYCVLMPNTARGGGISRKITNAADRKKLKEIANSLAVPEGAGLIIRTAGANRTKTEIKRDYEFLTRQWEQIRDLTLKSIAPCLIYEEGSLIKRAIRDLYSRDIDEIWVDGERGYREAKDYMKMLMPSHAKNVKHYAETLPLFSRYQVESYLAAMFNPVVQLKSGGYIVIDVTEALVAIDVNSGRATREASVEETALKTNLEAAEEAARQMRLRDLAGLIVIDFIDMDERKNNAAVEKRLKEKLKSDRARIQVGRISPFGLLEMSRQRLRPGMIEATTKACPHCHGTGRVRSDDSMALAILRELEEEGVRQRSKEVLIVCPVEIANYLLNQKREHIVLIESRFGLSVRIEGSASMISPEYRVERFKTASRVLSLPEPVATAVRPAEAAAEAAEESAEEGGEGAAPTREPAAETGERGGAKRRRRRRRRGRSQESREAAAGGERQESQEAPAAEPVAPGPAAEAEAQPAAAEPRVRSRRRSRGRAAEAAPERAPEAAPEPQPAGEEAAALEVPAEPVEAAVVPEPAQAASPPTGTPFDEVIDPREGAPGPDVVEVPEAAAAPPRRRERVRRPAAAVLAEVIGREPAPPEAEADAPADGRAEAAAGPEAETAAGEPAALGERPPEPLPEAAAEPAPAPAPLEVAVAEAPASGEGPAPASGTEPGAEPEPTAEASRPRKRGWWSRALGGG